MNSASAAKTWKTSRPRSGDVHVPGSRRYADPASFLLTPGQWEPRRLEFCHLTGKPASAADALALAADELHGALSDLETQLAHGGGPGEVRLTGDGELIIPPLTAEDIPSWQEFAPRHSIGLLEYLRSVPSCGPRQRRTLTVVVDADGPATKLAELRVYGCLAGPERRLPQNVPLSNNGVLADNDPAGQEKLIKLNTLLANLVSSTTPWTSWTSSAAWSPKAGPSPPPSSARAL